MFHVRGILEFDDELCINRVSQEETRPRCVPEKRVITQWTRYTAAIFLCRASARSFLRSRYNVV